MAIPRETNKELVVIVENESIEVAITPPVLDSAIVVGQPPPVDSRTLLFDGYEAESMRVRTVGGLQFEIEPVGEVPVVTVEQVLVGVGNPIGSIDGQTAGRIWIDSGSKSFYIWDGVSAPTDLQVIVNELVPAGGLENQILIETTSNSIWMWNT